MNKKTTVSVFVLCITALMIYCCGKEYPVQNNGGNNSGDTTFNAYVILRSGGTAVDTLHFTDINLYTGSYNTSSNSTYCLFFDTSIFTVKKCNSIILSFIS